ncbi:response regulator [Oscillatoria sp. FACHB-1407]|uniref:response regulator n=1 Tax=Oscillatoria sp. FACHB-1407 TaxID=2692847 RepID=UPI00168A0076|nr:response regulator [Oscillatoria sp. FACHB-1407]MBD2464689.1 response regulator [Oscillatoria sp. FACHB-1407]
MRFSTSRRIICVDPSRYDCELFIVILTLAGYEVEAVQSITGALPMMESNPFHAGVFTVSLMNASEVEALKTIRATAPSMSLIVCSSDSGDAARQQAMQAGAQAFFTKPIDFDQLTETIALLIP